MSIADAFAQGLPSEREPPEGVGFEPTVPLCGTLDFESSALNRTQPPFPSRKKTSNAHGPTSNPKFIEAKLSETCCATPEAGE